jgi:hypothetical protein
MTVTILAEIETADYEEKAFRKEFEELIKDIDPLCKLNKFRMYEEVAYDHQRTELNCTHTEL